VGGDCVSVVPVVAAEVPDFRSAPAAGTSFWGFPAVSSASCARSSSGISTSGASLQPSGTVLTGAETTASGVFSGASV